MRMRSPRNKRQTQNTQQQYESDNSANALTLGNEVVVDGAVVEVDEVGGVTGEDEQAQAELVRHNTVGVAWGAVGITLEVLWAQLDNPVYGHTTSKN